MRVVNVPGRTVRHWVTGRVIDESGILYDPNCLTTAHYLAAGDLDLVDEAPTGDIDLVDETTAAAKPGKVE